MKINKPGAGCDVSENGPCARGRPCPEGAEALSVSGEFRLVSIRVDGESIFALEERGLIFLDESDGDAFHEFVGIHFGARVELALALGRRPTT